MSPTDRTTVKKFSHKSTIKSLEPGITLEEVTQLYGPSSKLAKMFALLCQIVLLLCFSNGLVQSLGGKFFLNLLFEFTNVEYEYFQVDLSN